MLCHEAGVLRHGKIKYNCPLLLSQLMDKCNSPSGYRTERDFAKKKPLMENELYAAIDMNTVGVGITLGTTSTGIFEPAEEVSSILSKYQEINKPHIPIHVDAASGGFIAPFQFPDLKWDFRLNHVQSINISGHKYGMVYPSIGWVIWKKGDLATQRLRMKIEYLKNKFIHFGVNFSAPSAYIAAQYCNLRKFGLSGYNEKVNELFRFKSIIENELMKISFLTLISEDDPVRLPVVCWAYHEDYIFDVMTTRFDECGWIVPSCHISRSDTSRCCRIGIRHNFKQENFFKLTGDIESIHHFQP